MYSLMQTTEEIKIMKIPAFIAWLNKQDQRLEIAVIEQYTECKDYSEKDETQVKSFLFSDPDEQTKVEHGVLILGCIK